MNLVRELRARLGLTQQQLAAAAGTSQSAIAAYESGAKSPTVRTVERFAASLGLELAATFVPRMTIEDRRSLALHREIARLLLAEPARVVDRAAKNAERLAGLHPNAAALFGRWSQWLSLPPAELAARMLDPGMTAREMRHASPFSGLLDPRTRSRVLKRVRREHRQ